MSILSLSAGKIEDILCTECLLVYNESNDLYTADAAKRCKKIKWQGDSGKGGRNNADT